MNDEIRSTPEPEFPKHSSMEGLQARLLVGEFDIRKPVSSDDLSKKENKEIGFKKTVAALGDLSQSEREAFYRNETGNLNAKCLAWAIETKEKVEALPGKYKKKVHELIRHLVKEYEGLTKTDLGAEFSPRVFLALYDTLFNQSVSPIDLFIDELSEFYNESNGSVEEDLEVIQWFSGIFGADSAKIIAQFLDAIISEPEEGKEGEFYAHRAEQALEKNLDEEEKRLLNLLFRHEKDFTPVPRKAPKRTRPATPRVEINGIKPGELDEEVHYAVADIFASLKKPVEENKFSIESVPEEFELEDPDEFIPNKQEVFYTPTGQPGEYCPNPKTAPWAQELYLHNERYDEAEVLTDKDSGLLAMCAVATENPEDQALLYVHLARGIVRAHSQQPTLREAWEHVQRKDQITNDFLLSFEERREEGLKNVSDQAYKNDSKLYAVPAEMWKDRIARLELLLASPNPQLTRNELRWIEYLSHSVDVYGIFREIEKEGKKQKHFEIEDITVTDPDTSFYLLMPDEEIELPSFSLTNEEIEQVLEDYPELSISVEGDDEMRKKNEDAIKQFVSVLRNPQLLEYREEGLLPQSEEHAYGFFIGKSYPEQPIDQIAEKGWFYAHTGIMSDRYACPMAVYAPGNHAYLVLRGPYQNANRDFEIVYYDPKKEGEHIEVLTDMKSMADLENRDKSHIYSNPLWQRDYNRNPNSTDISISGNSGIPDSLKPYFMTGKLGGFQGDDIDCVAHCFFMAAVLNALKEGDSDFKKIGIPKFFNDYHIQLGTDKDFFQGEERKMADGFSRLRERHPSTDEMVDNIEQAVEEAQAGEKVEVTLSNEESCALVQAATGIDTEDNDTLEITRGKVKITGVAGSFESQNAKPEVRLESIKFEFTLEANKGIIKLSEVQVSLVSGDELSQYEKSVVQREIMSQDVHNEFTKYLLALLKYRGEKESLIEDEILVHIKDDHIELEMTKRGEAKAPPVKPTIGRAPSVLPEMPFTLDPSRDLFEQLKEGLADKPEVSLGMTVQEIKQILPNVVQQFTEELKQFTVDSLTVENMRIDSGIVCLTTILKAKSLKIPYVPLPLNIRGDLIVDLELITEDGVLKVRTAHINKAASSADVNKWWDASISLAERAAQIFGSGLNSNLKKILSQKGVDVRDINIELKDSKIVTKLSR